MSDTIIIPEKGSEDAIDWDRTLLVNYTDASGTEKSSLFTFRQIIASVAEEAFYSSLWINESIEHFLKRKNLL